MMKRILIVGIGGVGGLLAELLRESGFEVTGLDHARGGQMPDWLEVVEADVTSPAALAGALEGKDAVISCLPFHLTAHVAEAAHKAGVHYFDPTEDVATTEHVLEMGKTAHALMVPQCGLAPGIIGIMGAYLASLCDEGQPMRHIKLRVGALPRHPIGQLGYAGNWSLEGLVHECIAECDVIEDGERRKVPPLRKAEILRIDGVEYEAFTTSGGLGTMTETYLGRVETLNYKSIRYPGHLAGMKLLLEELRFREEPDLLVSKLRYALPPDDEDRVLVHASVQGVVGGKMQTKEIVADFPAINIAGKQRPAILWTTACSIAAVVEMALAGALGDKGFVRQEEIALTEFLKTKNGAIFAEYHEGLKAIKAA